MEKRQSPGKPVNSLSGSKVLAITDTGAFPFTELRRQGVGVFGARHNFEAGMIAATHDPFVIFVDVGCSEDSHIHAGPVCRHAGQAKVVAVGANPVEEPPEGIFAHIDNADLGSVSALLAGLCAMTSNT